MRVSLFLKICLLYEQYESGTLKNYNWCKVDRLTTYIEFAQFGLYKYRNDKMAVKSLYSQNYDDAGWPQRNLQNSDEERTLFEVQ